MKVKGEKREKPFDLESCLDQAGQPKTGNERRLEDSLQPPAVWNGPSSQLFPLHQIPHIVPTRWMPSQPPDLSPEEDVAFQTKVEALNKAYDSLDCYALAGDRVTAESYARQIQNEYPKMGANGEAGQYVRYAMAVAGNNNMDYYLGEARELVPEGRYREVEDLLKKAKEAETKYAQHFHFPFRKAKKIKQAVHTQAFFLNLSRSIELAEKGRPRSVYERLAVVQENAREGNIHLPKGVEKNIIETAYKNAVQNALDAAYESALKGELQQTRIRLDKVTWLANQSPEPKIAIDNMEIDSILFQAELKYNERVESAYAALDKCQEAASAGDVKTTKEMLLLIYYLVPAGHPAILSLDQETMVLNRSKSRAYWNAYDRAELAARGGNVSETKEAICICNTYSSYAKNPNHEKMMHQLLRAAEFNENNQLT